MKTPSSRGSGGALPILAAAALLEVGFLYLLIAVDTPLSGPVRRAVRNPAGVFAAVMTALTLVCLTMALGLTAMERSARRRAAIESTPGGPTPPPTQGERRPKP